MKRLLLVFGTLFTGIALFFVLLSGVGWEEIWLSLQAFSLLEAFMLLVLTGAFLFVGALRWKKILESQGETVPLAHLWKTYIAGFSLLFFIPVVPFANEMFRASALKDEQGVGLTQGTASVIIDRILEVTSNLCVVIIGGIIFLLAGNAFYSAKTFGVAAFVLLWIGLLSLLYIRLFQSKSVLQLFWKGNGYTKDVEQEVFLFFSMKNRFFWQGAWLSFLRSLTGLLRVWILIFFLGKGLVLLPGVTVLGFYYLAILVPIPAALGSHDALQAAGFSTFGLGVGTGAAFALLIRGVEALFAVAGLLLVAHFGFHLFGMIVFNKGKKLLQVCTRP